LTYSFDNQKIITNFALSHCCRFGNWKSPNTYEISARWGKCGL